MKIAVQFGAGNIGRGFLGQLYYESGYFVVFIDAVQELVQLLNKEKKYPLKITDNETERTIWIKNFKALHTSETQEISKFIKEAEVVSIAVGKKGIECATKILSEAIVNRLTMPNNEPLNIIICENLPEPKKTIKELIFKYLPPDLENRFEENIGLVEASIGRMVPVVSESEKTENPLLIKVEEYSELPVDKDGFKGRIPDIKNMRLCSPFSAYVHRKLYIHNLTHAVCAYLGALKNYTYIWEAVSDKEIYNIVYNAGSESAKAINKLDNLPLDELINHLNDLINRYRNKKLNDQIARVAKDPIRKLSPGERLIGSATYCLKTGILPEFISIGIASALFYEGTDEESIKLKEMRESEGIDKILIEICKISKYEPLYNLIKNSINKIEYIKKSLKSQER